jgi:hypothetical protein
VGDTGILGIRFVVSATVDGLFGRIAAELFRSETNRDLGSYKIVERTNAAVSLQCEVFRGVSSSAEVGLLAEYLPWKGEAFIKKTGSNDTVDTMLGIKGKETSLQFHVGYKKNISGIRLSVNSNQGFFNSGKAFFLDPGMSVGMSALTGEMEFSLGMTSAPADIRGVPGPQFDRILSRMYHTHLTARQRLFNVLNFSAEVFLKYKDRLFLYEDSPLSLSWDVDRKASLMAAGGSCQLEIKAGNWIALTTNLSVGRSRVFENGRKSNSDWDVPFANTTSFSLAVVPEKMRLYLIGNFLQGRPYRDVFVLDSSLTWGRNQSRLPDYRCIDLKCEWRQPTDGNFITEYDAFILLQNVFDWYNVREYRWFASKKGPLSIEKSPVSLSPAVFYMGGRINFRFFYWGKPSYKFNSRERSLAPQSCIEIISGPLFPENFGNLFDIDFEVIPGVV